MSAVACPTQTMLSEASASSFGSPRTAGSRGATAQPASSSRAGRRRRTTANFRIARATGSEASPARRLRFPGDDTG
jgi:hypothetical protein